MLRLAVGAFGVATAVALLFGSASLSNMVADRDARQAQQVRQLTPKPGVDPLYVQGSSLTYRGEWLHGTWMYPAGASAPVPPGLTRQLEPGELAVSPALANLLDSPDGALLRLRFDDLRRVATIGKVGVVEPHDLRFYVGADSSLSEGVAETRGSAQPILAAYGFGAGHAEPRLPIDLVGVIAVSVVALLFPVLILVGASTRIAGSERDRRLAAIRLLGASARRVRRISAAEALVPAVLGLLLGAVLFKVARPVVAEFEFFGYSTYASDIVPNPVLVVLIVCAVPVLAIASALLAQRRIIVEPLGVVRQSTARRRRLWWRLLLLGIGVAILAVVPIAYGLVSALIGIYQVSLGLSMIVVGVLVVLFGLVALLPWAVERAVSRIDRGGPSCQLAIRRLQHDSGTSARVFSGLALALVGGVAVQVLLVSYQASWEERSGMPRGDDRMRSELMLSTPTDSEPALAALREQLEVKSAAMAYHAVMFFQTYQGAETHVLIAECDTLRAAEVVPDCHEGGVFLSPTVVGDGPSAVRPGDDLVIGKGASPLWRVPRSATVTKVGGFARFDGVEIVVTPAALGPAFEHIGVMQPIAYAVLHEEADFALRADILEHVRNAYGLTTTPPMTDTVGMSGAVQPDVTPIRALLLVCVLFVLGVAVLGVLVTSGRATSGTGACAGVDVRERDWLRYVGTVGALAERDPACARGSARCRRWVPAVLGFVVVVRTAIHYRLDGCRLAVRRRRGVDAAAHGAEPASVARCGVCPEPPRRVMSCSAVSPDPDAGFVVRGAVLLTPRTNTRAGAGDTAS
ncbi:MAG: FtsX-like permease family protein [Actinophytocola sp.]|nr:FtsX-like permease family protein [Actinophytocola sp.]